MTQTELAEKLGMSTRAIQHYEQGRSQPPMKKLPSICEVLGVSPAYFADASDESNSSTGNEVSSNYIKNDGDSTVSPEEREFLDWVKNNLTGAFFYDFDKSPEDSKKHMMDTLRLVWERERGRKPGQKQGE